MSASGNRKSDIRNRFVDHDEHRRYADPKQKRSCLLDWLEIRRKTCVCVGGEYQLYGSGDQLAERSGETDRQRRRDRTFMPGGVKDDDLYFVPAFIGLGAPYWNSACRGSLTGSAGTTGREEIVRACVESIAYQIRDVVDAMGADAGICPESLRVDGGPTKNTYLMQFQSDMLGSEVLVSDSEEMSAIGAACAAGIVLGILPADVTEQIKRTAYHPPDGRRIADKKMERLETSRRIDFVTA